MADTDEYIAKYLGYVDMIIAKIPYKRVPVWKEFFLNPVATVRKDKVGIGQRMKDLVVSGAIGAVIGIVAALPALIIATIASGGAGLIMIAALPILMVLGILLTPLFAFLYSLLQLAVAKLLGGVGDMKANFNASVLPSLGTTAILLPVSLIAIPVAWLSAIPLVSICVMVVQVPLTIVSGLVGLYGWYLGYLAMKEVHALSTLRAAAVVLVPMVLIIGLVFVAVFAIYAFLIATLIGMSTALSAAG